MMKKLIQMVVIFGWVVIVNTSISTHSIASNLGEFTPNEPVVRLISNGKIALVSDLFYRDLRGELWLAPEGIIVDGASIPQVFWSFIGGPLNGEYRNASIIHDYYCEKRSRTAAETHAVFYESMLQSDVNPVKAWIMFKAVETFGPNWKIAPPIGCINDKGEFDIEKCAQNSGAIPNLEPSNELTPENMAQFLAELDTNGYSMGVETLKLSLPPSLLGN